MERKFCFVAVEFIYDPNVLGYTYWYLCDDENIKVGDVVIALLGRHNREQTGVVRRISFETAENAPFNIEHIKKIKGLAPSEKE